MNSISLNNLGRRFNRDWIFRNVNFRFTTGFYALLGHNGSGKSTLLSLISGQLSPTEGEVTLSINQNSISIENFFQHIAWVAPYTELPEELSLKEFFEFHFSIRAGKIANVNEFAELAMLPNDLDKAIRHFSSGMKQRLKLLTALISNTEVLLLDEPLSNLDDKGEAWYFNMLDRFSHNKIVLIASNQEREYSMCDHKIDITDFK